MSIKTTEAPPLMRTLAFFNQKGGVGLARPGRRVVLADLAPQGHMTRSLGRPRFYSPGENTAELTVIV